MKDRTGFGQRSIILVTAQGLDEENREGAKLRLARCWNAEYNRSKGKESGFGRYPPERLASGRAGIPALISSSMTKHGVTGVLGSADGTRWHAGQPLCRLAAGLDGNTTLLTSRLA